MVEGGRALPDARYIIQHSPNAGWYDVGIGGNPEQSHPYKKNDASSEQSFHGRILPRLCFCGLPKFRIGGLHQKKAPAAAVGQRQELPRTGCEGRTTPPALSKLTPPSAESPKESPAVRATGQ